MVTFRHLIPYLALGFWTVSHPLLGAEPREKPTTRHGAVIAWCHEDAAAARAAGLNDIAEADAADETVLAAKPLAAADGTSAPDLLPPIPGDAKANPLVVDAVKRVEVLIKEDKTFAKGPAGGEIRDASGWAFPTRAEQLLLLTQAFCHPQSPLAGDPRLVAPILRRVASLSEYLVPGHKCLGDFGFSDNLADAWLILRTTRPEILPPGLAARTAAGLRVNADFIAAKHGDLYRATGARYGVVNMDVRWILTLALSARLFPESTYGELVAGGVDFLGYSVLADGATHYAERQNECFGYHSAAVRSLLRIAQITGLAQARDLVAKMRWYYPLSVEPNGVAEWASASSWHHYWNMVNGSDGALMMAGTLGCPHNQRIALDRPPKGDLWLAAYLRPDLKPAPAPDQYFVYDRNVEGPRGRFGTWSFVGTGRNFAYDGTTPSRGKTSYVGAVLQTGATSGWPLDAALQDAGCAVRISDKPLPVGEIPWIHELACLTSVESATTAVGERCAALGSSALLGTYGGKPTPWRQRQAWIFTPERLVGVVELEAEQDATARGLMGTLMLVSGRGGWGVRKELNQTGPGAYTYGGLAVTIHAHDYADITGQETDVMSGSVTHGTDTPGKSVRLLLKDRAGDESTAYAKGTRHFYLVEIRPAATPPAKGASQGRHPDGLLTVDLQDGTGIYRLAYNPGGGAVDWQGTPAGGVLHRSGETWRPAWIGADGKSESAHTATPWTGGTASIPAGQLALIAVPGKR